MLQDYEYVVSVALSENSEPVEDKELSLANYIWCSYFVEYQKSQTAHFEFVSTNAVTHSTSLELPYK